MVSGLKLAFLNHTTSLSSLAVVVMVIDAALSSSLATLKTAPSAIVWPVLPTANRDPIIFLDIVYVVLALHLI